MRELKFRQWTTGWASGTNRMIYLGDLKDEDFSPLQDGELMQYTGLKDKNGKEIYEGDIVKGKNYGFNNPIRYIGTVEYVYNKFKVIGCRNKYKGTNDELNTIYEVLGNIYENPELL